jgi:hypothetical protein
MLSFADSFRQIRSVSGEWADLPNQGGQTSAKDDSRRERPQAGSVEAVTALDRNLVRLASRPDNNEEGT